MESETIKISILICTYNRDYILRECLNSLVTQTADKLLYEVIIINNNSTDKTLEIGLEFTQNYKNFRVVTESNQGLSHARNRGYLEAKYDWVAFVDDDAKAYPNFVERAQNTIKNYTFDCFGGMYYPWYRDTIRPKWLSEKFGQSIKYFDNVSNLTNGYISGGVCAYKKMVLVDIGGFPIDLGMKGNTLAYGEETYVQNKLVEKGYSVGFDPELCIHHLVPEYKQKVNWHIRSAYANGRDSVKIWKCDTKVTIYKQLKSIAKLLLKQLPKSLYTFITKKDYYVENLYLDTFQPLARIFGYYKAINS